MRRFLETAFGPQELLLVEQAFNDWLNIHKIQKDSPEGELAAAIVINVYREGHDTKNALELAMADHRGLKDLIDLAS